MWGTEIASLLRALRKLYQTMMPVCMVFADDKVVYGGGVQLRKSNSRFPYKNETIKLNVEVSHRTPSCQHSQTVVVSSSTQEPFW